MKIAFHTNTLSNRGTTVAILDYAQYNQELLGNDSIIVYPLHFSDPGIPVDSLTRPEIVDSISKKFTLFGYSSQEELEQYCLDNNVDYTYYIKAGFNDGPLNSVTKNLIHAVFQANNPHGDKYAYISDWLSHQMSGGLLEFVPHIVDLPKTAVSDYRKKLNISDDKVVIGRIGGFHQFDIQWVLQTVANFAFTNPNYIFVFVNTFKFVDLPNVLFLESIFDEQEKTDFILSCDAMIHARSDGESFGLAICEGLFHDKPVFCFNGGRDKHHIKLLQDTNLLYNTPDDLWIKLLNVKNNYRYEYSKLVQQFTPELVMEKFNKVFINNNL
jgi:hypothetical protein